MGAGQELDIAGLRVPDDSAEAAAEAGWIDRARQGDERAFASLVRRHGPFAYTLALRTIGDPAEAEDVAQEAFVRAWRAMPGFRVDGRFSTWLYRIVVNLCYDRAPRMRRALASIPVEAAWSQEDGRPAPEAAIESMDLRRQIYASIDDLPEPYRLLITLRHLDHMSYAEIASITSMPLGTVKTGIHRGRRRLMNALLEAGVTPAGWESTEPGAGPDPASGIVLAR